jgi:hypothetical protein
LYCRIEVDCKCLGAVAFYAIVQLLSAGLALHIRSYPSLEKQREVFGHYKGDIGLYLLIAIMPEVRLFLMR